MKTTAKPSARIKTPNTAIARSIIQFKNTNYKNIFLEFVYAPKLIDRAKITTLLMSKLLEAYNVKGKRWENEYILITIQELVELGVMDTQQGNKYNLEILNQCTKSVATARLATPCMLAKGAEYAYTIFTAQIPYIVDGKTQGYIFKLSRELPIQGLCRNALKSYGNLPRWAFNLSNDGFLVCYYLITHKELATKCNYKITLQDILKALEPTLGVRSRAGRPTTRIQKAIDEINNTDQKDIMIYERQEPLCFICVVSQNHQ